MPLNKNGKRMDEYQILKLCMKYYLTDITNIKILGSVLIVCIVLRRVLDFTMKNVLFKLNELGGISTTIQQIFVYSTMSGCLSFVTDYIIAIISAGFQTNISVKAFERILKTEACGTIDLTPGKTQYAISEGSYAMIKLFEHCFIELLLKISYLTVDISLITSNLSPYHVLVGVSVALISTIIHLKGAVIIMDCKRKINQARGQCDKKIYEDVSSYEIIKSYQTEDKEVDNYKAKIRPWRDAFIYRAKVATVLALVHDVLFALSAYIFSNMLIYQKVQAPNTYRTGYNCIRDLERSVENISSIYIKYVEAIVTSQMILYYLNGIQGFAPGTTIKQSFDSCLTFTGVGYTINDILIFKNINFSILKGEKVCIFGRNGSGKSTISRLIMRLCRVTTGIIEIDGIDIYETQIEFYRKLYTYVPQDTSLFDDTVFSNLIYGNNRSFSKVVEVCKKLNIHDDIIRLEKGYNTNVGERGSSINGGLRQKIFYARSILFDTPFYIFDEPTNNLDEDSSSKIIDMILGEHFGDKTVLAICHDHNMVNRFPKVLYFSGGTITEKIKQ